MEEKLCVCGHNVTDHEDHDFYIHECNACDCPQFLDVDKPNTQTANLPPDEVA